jgi:tryptophanyl-tRNA synthetase
LEHVDAVIAPMRAQYEALMADPERIEATLLAGAERARALATPFLRELRNAVGLRSLAPSQTVFASGGSVFAAGRPSAKRLPAFKQYREQDGKFYFKLLDADGRLLLQSTGFVAPKEAGQAIAALKRDGLAALAGQHLPVEGVAESEVGAALTALAEAAT